MDHNDIRHKLSEFIDSAITPGEKADIEQHLKTCSECADALRELRKTIEHVHAVEEMESPAWMTQKIMAKVRAEQEARTGLWQRVFAPFLMKFPVQAVAVLFLAVTAYYIYHSINPAQKYTEEPVGMLAKKEAPAVGPMKEESKAFRDASPEAKQDSRKPGYKSLDMKYSYEKPAEPVPRDRMVASAPAPARQAEQTFHQDKADLEKIPIAPKTAAPSMMAEQAAPAAGAANQVEEKKKSMLNFASSAKTTNDIDTINLQKYIGRRKSELSSFSEMSADKSDQGASNIGKDHILLTRTVRGTLVVFFAKFFGPDKPGKERDAVITDAMIHTASGENRNLLSWWCASSDQADLELMAVVDTSLRLERLPAINAWRMNRKTGKFEPVAPINITCVNESYGH